MGIHNTRRRDYRGQDEDGNVFAWIVEECERIRHWDQAKRERVRIPARRPPDLFRLNPHNSAGPLLNPNVPCPDAPGKNTFEIAKARKL